MTFEINGFSRMNSIGTKPDGSQPVRAKSDEPFFRFNLSTKPFDKPDPYLRNMLNYGKQQQEYWTMAYGEPTIKKTQFGDEGDYTVMSTWNTDRGPISVEVWYDKDNNERGKAYEVGLTDGGVARYNHNGELVGTRYPDGSFIECTYFDDDSYYN